MNHREARFMCYLLFLITICINDRKNLRQEEDARLSVEHISAQQAGLGCVIQYQASKDYGRTYVNVGNPHPVNASFFDGTKIPWVAYLALDEDKGTEVRALWWCAVYPKVGVFNIQ